MTREHRSKRHGPLPALLGRIAEMDQMSACINYKEINKPETESQLHHSI